uniref:D-beta-hydroxybutyrate dehydrogenase, mitochondrial-like protein n=1 Tax=Callorhinchus milii TaxID=7868 RepID=V9L2Y1_CALMI
MVWAVGLTLPVVLCSLGLTAVCLLALLAWLVSGRTTGRAVEGKGRAVLVTGCDTGFGHLLAQQLDELGFHVFAGCLSTQGPGAQTLAQTCSSKLRVFKMDVTRDEDVAAAKEYVLSNLPQKGLWAIVNNAGITAWGEVEWNTLESYQRLVDVNLWGSVRTTKASLPLLRESKGRIVFMSSISATIHSKGTSMYAITKSGIEAFARCLTHEMKRFGVNVSIVQPGNFSRATNILQEPTFEEVWNKLSDMVKESYGKDCVQNYIHGIRYALSHANKNATDVTNIIIEALMSPKPKIRYCVTSVPESIVLFICNHFLSWDLYFLFNYIEGQINKACTSQN